MVEGVGGFVPEMVVTQEPEEVSKGISRRQLLKLGIGALAAATIGPLLKPPGEVHASAEMRDASEMLGEAEFGEEQTASEAIKKAYEKYLQKRKVGEAESQEMAQDLYSENVDTSTWAGIRVGMITDNEAVFYRGWKTVYDDVNDHDDSTLVSQEINNRFSLPGRAVVCEEFFQIPKTLTEVKQQFSGNLDAVKYWESSGGLSQPLVGQAAFEALGIK